MSDGRLAALGRPIWNALTTGWAHLAEGDRRAWRLKRDYGMFGAAADRTDESLSALAELVPAAGELWLVERDAQDIPGTRVLRARGAVQMAARAITLGPSPDVEILDLSDTDAPEMFDLASLTQPGPYVAHTNRLGCFIGIRRDGRLVAMAGERMRMPGMAEVSAVCTHPDWRGRGYAAALMRIVAQRMLARGEVPFLHAYADNEATISLYRTLGFEVAGEVVATVIVRG